ncbi:MAG: Wzz/FepE/Etk N-terminal domain-containing protein [Candidatus Zixiibacteriota bacterium]
MEKIKLHHDPEEPTSAFWQSFVLPVLRYKKLTYAITAASVSLTLVICLLIPNKYTSTAALLPTTNNDQISDLKELAAGTLGDLGLGSLKQVSDQSSALYPQILSSRTISEAILKRSYKYDDDGAQKSITLSEYVEQPNIDLELTALSELVGIWQDRKTGMVYLSVTTTYPELSANIVHAYLDELNDYNVNKRQSKARANQQFMARRLDEIKHELAQAEDSLLAFKEQNRNFDNSADPELQLELQRRERLAMVKSEEFGFLTKQHELARIDAVKDIPVVNVLDSGSVPIMKSWPRRSIYLLGALLGSLFGGIVLSLWLDISGKRRFRDQFSRTLHSPDIQYSRLEERFLQRIERMAGRATTEDTNEKDKTTLPVN